MGELHPGVDVKVRPSITLSDNYNRLKNKPQINGITLEGNKTSEELNILNTDPAGYEEIELSEVGDGYVLVLGEDKTTKVKIAGLASGRFSTTDNVEEVPDGAYIFKTMEDITNGTDN